MNSPCHQEEFRCDNDGKKAYMAYFAEEWTFAPEYKAPIVLCKECLAAYESTIVSMGRSFCTTPDCEDCKESERRWG